MVRLPSKNPTLSDLCEGDRSLPVLPDLELTLTVNQVFDWLKMGRSLESI